MNHNSDSVNRPISEKVAEALDKFLLLASNSENNLTFRAWETFYDFVTVAYRAGGEHRPSLSQLAAKLLQLKINNAGNICVTYAHCLYALARHEERPIYGEEFNP